MHSRKRHALKGLLIGVAIAISPVILTMLLEMFDVRTNLFAFTIGLPGILLYGLITLDPHGITPLWWMLLNVTFWAALGLGVGLLRADRATHKKQPQHLDE